MNSFENKLCQINQIQHGWAASGRASNIVPPLYFSPKKMTKNFAETFRKKKDSLFYKKERELAQFIIKTEFEHHITKGVSHLYKQLRYDSTKNTWV